MASLTNLRENDQASKKEVVQVQSVVVRRSTELLSLQVTSR